jgi:hypothetical protein
VAQVVAVQFEQVEGVQEHDLVVAAMPKTIKRRHAALVAGDGLAVDDAGARPRPRQRVDDQREAAGQVVARPAVELDPLAVLAGDDADASCLFSCSHSSPEGGLGALVGRPGEIKPGCQGTRQHAGLNRLGRRIGKALDHVTPDDVCRAANRRGARRAG